VGRKSDIVIRGGKNISAAQVEMEVETHPAVALVSVVPVADPLFGERVCAVVCLHPGTTLDLANLTAHLIGRGMTPELCPERLVITDDLPRSSGGKLAKGEIRELAERSVVDQAGDRVASTP
jgi:acyl-CoA synthetase